ncbi:MAG: ABC-three component system protein [archaeon]
MTDKARQYKRSTIRRLDTLGGNQCYNPECTNQLIAYDGETIISKICHIEGASGNGPRYNPQMSDDERRSFDNLLLLCDGCHSVVDNMNNLKKYPIHLLKEWKKTHEDKQKYEHLKNPSLLKMAVNAISKITFEDDAINDDNQNLTSFKIQAKITYNSIKRNKSLIEEYKVYYSKINTLYTEMEKQGSFKKENLLRNIKTIYLKVKGRYVLDSNDEMKIICENADNIIEDIEEEIYNLIDTNKPNNFSFEVSVIIVDAFMRCKILEEPLK